MTEGTGSSGTAGKGAGQGMPRWLVRAFVAKLVLVVLIVAAIVWWAGR